jgi:superfamily I DNA and/or RNA helicase
MGFLTDWRRLNVAITRARRGLILVGDGSTLQADPTWCEYLEYIRGEGGAISADDVERQLREWRGLEEGEEDEDEEEGAGSAVEVV